MHRPTRASQSLDQKARGGWNMGPGIQHGTEDFEDFVRMRLKSLYNTLYLYIYLHSRMNGQCTVISYYSWVLCIYLFLGDHRKLFLLVMYSLFDLSVLIRSFSLLLIAIGDPTCCSC